MLWQKPQKATWKCSDLDVSHTQMFARIILHGKLPNSYIVHVKQIGIIQYGFYRTLPYGIPNDWRKNHQSYYNNCGMDAFLMEWWRKLLKVTPVCNWDTVRRIDRSVVGPCPCACPLLCACCSVPPDTALSFVGVMDGSVLLLVLLLWPSWPAWPFPFFSYPFSR